MARGDRILLASIIAGKIAVLLIVFLAYQLIPFSAPNFEVNFVDPAYPGPWCSSSLQTGSKLHQQVFLNDSVTSPDGVLTYPNTTVRFLFGGLDNSSAIRQGLDYRSKIVQPTTFACVKDAPHSIPDVLDGAQTIAADLITNCHH